MTHEVGVVSTFFFIFVSPFDFKFTYSLWGRGRGGLNTGFSEFFSLIPGFPGEFFVIPGFPEVFSMIPGSECFLIDFATILCNIVSKSIKYTMLLYT